MSATIIELTSRREMSDYRHVTEEPDSSVQCELRRARLRIAQLERNLTQAMRDSLKHYNRAREAERRLEEIAG